MLTCDQIRKASPMFLAEIATMTRRNGGNHYRRWLHCEPLLFFLREDAHLTAMVLQMHRITPPKGPRRWFTQEIVIDELRVARGVHNELRAAAVRTLNKANEHPKWQAHAKLQIALIDHAAAIVAAWPQAPAQTSVEQWAAAHLDT